MKPTWATHYTFYKLGEQGEHFIPKGEIQTWFDLKYDLDDYVGIDHRLIDIVINNRPVFYENTTLLQDVDIKQTDTCFVLSKPNFDKAINAEDKKKNQTQYLELVQREIQRNKIKIQNKSNHPLFIKSLQNINASEQLKVIYKTLVEQFSKWQCLVAFQECKGDYGQIRTYILEGKARVSLAKITQAQQKEQINEFLSQKLMRQLKQSVFSKDKTVQTYGHIMRQLYQQFPYFKQLQNNHQVYVQRKLLNQSLYPSHNIELERKINAIFASVQKQKNGKYITQQQLQTFKRIHSKTYTVQDINSALIQAGNNLRYTEQLLKGKVDNSKNLVMCLKKSSRLNLVLQFFSQPIFEKIRVGLVGNKDKCLAFIDFVISKNKSHSYLVSLIKKYKSYVVTMLSKVYSIEQVPSLQKSQLSFEQQLTQQEQQYKHRVIEDNIDQQLVQCLRKGGLQQQLAVSSVRASNNSIQQLETYLLLGGINKKYDFCNPKLQDEQKYLSKYFKKDKETLVKLQQQQFYLLWLGSARQTSPRLYQIIIKNKRFLDRLIADSVQSK